MVATKRILAYILIGLLPVLVSCQSTEKANYHREVEKSKEFVQRRFNDMNAQSNKRLGLLHRLFSLETSGSKQIMSELRKAENEVNNLQLKNNAIVHSQLDQQTLDKYIHLQEKITDEVIALDLLVNNNGTMSQPGLSELLIQLKKVTKRISIDARKFSYQLKRHNESYPEHKIPLTYSISNSILDKVAS
ncbi:hypothetical protein [Runella sp.]|uniref:hypothetical protein n=1 Tax=Runella sp. TaxID=1960881 RepID=UPI003D0BAEE3